MSLCHIRVFQSQMKVTVFSTPKNRVIKISCKHFHKKLEPHKSLSPKLKVAKGVNGGLPTLEPLQPAVEREALRSKVTWATTGSTG